MKITRILHAGYIFESEGIQIAFDPVLENPFSHNCYAFPNVRFDHEQIKDLKLAAVFISHFHDDHLCLESLNHLDRQTPIYLFSIHEEFFSMLKELGFQHVSALRLDSAVEIGPFRITPRRALDADVDSIFHIQVENLNILNVVDSWIDLEMLDLLAKEKSWDLILWPFQTMREIEVLSPNRAGPAEMKLPPEWIEQLQILNPKCIVPSSCQFVQESWSWYNHFFFPISYQGFQSQIEAILPKTRVLRLNPGISVVMTQNSIQASEALSWIEPLGEQNVDYKYDPNLIPPSAAEAARHFAPLNQEQTERVRGYCRSVLPEVFRSLQGSEEGYFRKPRSWRLSVFDHNGLPEHFDYQIKGTNIELQSERAESIHWLTEVSSSKLHSALENGESLTSMYIRINDPGFDSPTETEIQSADVLEDPLVRCLFTGAVGAYQKAQLKRLQQRERK